MKDRITVIMSREEQGEKRVTAQIRIGAYWCTLPPMTPDEVLLISIRLENTLAGVLGGEKESEEAGETDSQVRAGQEGLLGFIM